MNSCRLSFFVVSYLLVDICGDSFFREPEVATATNRQFLQMLQETADRDPEDFVKSPQAGVDVWRRWAGMGRRGHTGKFFNTEDAEDTEFQCETRRILHDWRRVDSASAQRVFLLFRRSGASFQLSCGLAARRCAGKPRRRVSTERNATIFWFTLLRHPRAEGWCQKRNCCPDVDFGVRKRSVRLGGSCWSSWQRLRWI